MFVIVKNILLSVFSPQFKTLLSKYSYFLARMNLQEMYNVQKKTILMKFFQLRFYVRQIASCLVYLLEFFEFFTCQVTSQQSAVDVLSSPLFTKLQQLLVSRCLDLSGRYLGPFSYSVYRTNFPPPRSHNKYMTKEAVSNGRLCIKLIFSPFLINTII